MFCYNCGKEVNENEVICLGCGTAVSLKPKAVGKPKTGDGRNSVLVHIFSTVTIVSSVLTLAFIAMGSNVVFDTYGYSDLRIYLLVNTVFYTIGISFALHAVGLSVVSWILARKQSQHRPILAFLVSLIVLILAMVMMLKSILYS